MADILLLSEALRADGADEASAVVRSFCEPLPLPDEVDEFGAYFDRFADAKGDLGRTPPPRRRLLEPIALAVQLQNMDMVREAIEQRAGEPLAAEDACPFLERQIRGDNGRAAFMTLAEDLEEQLRAGLGERHIAEFVDDEQFDGGELGLELEQTPFVARLHQLMHEAGRCEEGDGEAALTSGEAERQTDMRLAGAGRSSDILPGIRTSREESTIGSIRALVRWPFLCGIIAFRAPRSLSSSRAMALWRTYLPG